MYLHVYIYVYIHTHTQLPLIICGGFAPGPTEDANVCMWGREILSTETRKCMSGEKLKGLVKLLFMFSFISKMLYKEL